MSLTISPCSNFPSLWDRKRASTSLEVCGKYYGHIHTATTSKQQHPKSLIRIKNHGALCGFYLFILKKLHIFTLFKIETFNPRLISLPLATFSSFCWKGWGELYRDCHIPLLSCSVVYFNTSCSESLPSPLFLWGSICLDWFFFFPSL